MTTETDQILDMIDSIEEAIVHEAPWSNAPPEAPAPSPEAAEEVAAVEAAAAALDEVASAPAYRAPRSEPRPYPDPPPRSVAFIPRVRGSTEQILARFKWGER